MNEKAKFRNEMKALGYQALLAQYQETKLELIKERLFYHKAGNMANAKRGDFKGHSLSNVKYRHAYILNLLHNKFKNEARQ